MSGIKKLFYLGGLGVVFAISHLGVQNFAKTSVEKELKQKTDGYVASLNQKIAYSHGSVSFSYSKMRIEVEDVELNVGGNPGVASVSIGEYHFYPFSKKTEIVDVNALSIIQSGGALSIASIGSLSQTSDMSIEGDDWSFFRLNLKGLEVSDVFYKGMFSDDVRVLVKDLMEDGALDVDIDVNKETDGVSKVSFSASSRSAFEIIVDVDYQPKDIVSNGTPINHDAAEPISVGVPPAEGYVVSGFDLSIEDMGIREKVFVWGASMASSPSLDDNIRFKENFVSGLDAYINQVIEVPLLPRESMNDFVEFVDRGGRFSASVEFGTPISQEILWLQMMGHPQSGIYEGAKITGGVE